MATLKGPSPLHECTKYSQVALSTNHYEEEGNKVAHNIIAHDERGHFQTSECLDPDIHKGAAGARLNMVWA